jgi:hypothetical protein
MKTFVFDDRTILPSYFCFFLDSLTVHEHVYLITPARFILTSNGQVRSLTSCKTMSVIDPSLIKNYSSIVNAFDTNFVNFSTGNFSFERACFLRWFAVNLATADLDDSDYICIVDSDFVLGCSPSFILKKSQQQSKSFPLEFISTWADDHSGIINPQITILTKRLLFSFCRYLFCEYFSFSQRSVRLGEWFDTIGRGFPGGICDMSALGSWLSSVRPNKFNLYKLEGFILLNNFNIFLDKHLATNKPWMLSFSIHMQQLCDNSVYHTLLGTHFQGTAKRWISNLRLSSRETISLRHDSQPIASLNPSIYSRAYIKLLIMTRKYVPFIHSNLLTEFLPLGDHTDKI